MNGGERPGKASVGKANDEFLGKANGTATGTAIGEPTEAPLVGKAKGIPDSAPTGGQGKAGTGKVNDITETRPPVPKGVGSAGKPRSELEETEGITISGNNTDIYSSVVQLARNTWD